MVVQTSALPGVSPLSLALAPYLTFKDKQAAQNIRRVCQKSCVAGEVDAQCRAFPSTPSHVAQSCSHTVFTRPFGGRATISFGQPFPEPLLMALVATGGS